MLPHPKIFTILNETPCIYYNNETYYVIYVWNTGNGTVNEIIPENKKAENTKKYVRPQNEMYRLSIENQIL